MQKQEKQWSKIDQLMDKKIKTLRLKKVIASETLEQQVQKLSVPADVKFLMLRQYIEGRRRAFFEAEKARIRNNIKKKMLSAFKEQHARVILQGSEELVRALEATLEQRDKMEEKNPYDKFRFFSMDNRKSVGEQIKEAHYRQETFDIKVK